MYAETLLSNNENMINDGTIIWTKNQTNGKGQYNRQWISTSGLNLTFSIITFPNSLLATQMFYLNIVVSMGVVALIQNYYDDVFIKWPNDIYCKHNLQLKKISGLLIKNGIVQQYIKSSIMGIGCNVNETEFSKNLENAISLKKITNIHFQLSELFLKMIDHINYYYIKLYNNKYDELMTQYCSMLFGWEKPMKILVNGKIEIGKIINIAQNGKLQIQINQQTSWYEHGQIQILL